MRPQALELVRAIPLAAGWRVLDVGSLNVNGSPRDLVCSTGASYRGLDMRPGPNVDMLWDATELGRRFQPHEWHVALCFDMLEHVRDWQAVIASLRYVVRPGGYIALCAAPIGFGRHDYPGDFWRFTLSDLRAALVGCEEIAADAALPGLVIRTPQYPEVAEVI